MSSFSSSLTPAGMWSAFRRICDQHTDVRTLLYIMGPEKIAEWIHSVGVVTHHQLAAFVPPIPPAALREVVAASEAEVFLWTGFVDLIKFIDIYRQHHGTGSTRSRVLDFGCGCGRMTRFFCHSSESWDVVASDVNPELVDFCRQNLRGVSTSLNGVEPPLPFDSASFDLIYSLSIFTHFQEEFSTTWLNELGRILAPNGILIITTHGYPALEVIRESALHHQMFQMTRDKIHEIQRDFAEISYVFQRYSSSVLAAARAGAEYGNTFIHPDYVHRNWNNDKFAVREHIPGGLRGWQDIVVLQRRSS